MASFSSKPIVCRAPARRAYSSPSSKTKGETSPTVMQPSEVGAVSPSVFLLWSLLCLYDHTYVPVVTPMSLWSHLRLWSLLCPCGHTYISGHSYVPVGLWQLLNLPQPRTATSQLPNLLGGTPWSPWERPGDWCPGRWEDADLVLEAQGQASSPQRRERLQASVTRALRVLSVSLTAQGWWVRWVGGSDVLAARL